MAYGEVARRAGFPGRARLVARLLCECSDPTLPWHRVTGSGGRIRIPEGDPARAEQIRRLRAEGVALQGDRVRCSGPAQHLPLIG